MRHKIFHHCIFKKKLYLLPIKKSNFEFLFICLCVNNIKNHKTVPTFPTVPNFSILTNDIHEYFKFFYSFFFSYVVSKLDKYRNNFKDFGFSFIAMQTGLCIAHWNNNSVIIFIQNTSKDNILRINCEQMSHICILQAKADTKFSHRRSISSKKRSRMLRKL